MAKSRTQIQKEHRQRTKKVLQFYEKLTGIMVSDVRLMVRILESDSEITKDEYEYLFDAPYEAIKDIKDKNE